MHPKGQVMKFLAAWAKLAAVVGLGFAASPSHAAWSSASHLIDGMCSSFSKGRNGILASILVDRDMSASLVLDIPGQKGSYFVLNFSDGTDQVFVVRDNSHIALKMSDELLFAFRMSSGFKLFKSGSGFIGGDFSLAGSSEAVSSAIDCVAEQRAKRESSAAGKLGNAIPIFSLAGVQLDMSPNQVEASLAVSEFKPNRDSSSGIVRGTGVKGERFTTYFSGAESDEKVNRFFILATSMISDEAFSLPGVIRTYGEPSAMDNGNGSLIWYRTDSGHVLQGASPSYLTCPGSATSRLVLRPGATTEISVDDCNARP